MFRQILGMLLIATSLSACAPQLSTNTTGDSNSGPLTPISSTDGIPVIGSSCGSLSAAACEQVLSPTLSESMSFTDNVSSYNAGAPDTWRCYSTNATGASNFALGASGPGAIMVYVDDFGSHNYALGRRRWIFYPALSQVGLGAVPGADALQVIGGWGADPSPNSFVAWPSRGYFPSSLLPGSHRWSFSRSGIGLSQARVRMFKNGSPISVTLEPFAAGYGEDALVWQPQEVERSEVTFREIIDNLSSGGNIDYQVRVMGDL